MIYAIVTDAIVRIFIILIELIQNRNVFLGALRSGSQTADVPSCNAAAEWTFGRGLVEEHTLL